MGKGVILVRYRGIGAGSGGRRALGSTQDKITGPGGSEGLLEVGCIGYICVLSDSIW